MTNRLTGKLIPKDNRNVQFYADFFPNGDIGGGGSGSTGGIPTIDKNTQPNIVFREPTAEDLAKFPNLQPAKVADLTNGEVPLFLIIADEGAEPGNFEGFPLTAFSSPVDGNEGNVEYGDASFILSEDWTLLGALGGGQ